MGRPQGNLGWRDSSNTERKKPAKKKEPPKKATQTIPPKPKEPEGPIPFELLQLLLNIFKTSFSQLLESDFTPLLQEVKQHLFNRDFAQAFGRQDYLEAYAARWSPSRALGYLEIFEYISKHAFTFNSQDGANHNAPYKAVCFGGGGGAEVVALAGFLDYLNRCQILQQEASSPAEDPTGSKIPAQTPTFDVHSVDIANWAPVLASLNTSITSLPPLSKYAPAATKAANRPLLIPASFSVTSHQHDLLAISAPVLSTLLQDASLVTLMFTLNELYSTSVSKTQELLLKMTAAMRAGAFLLVVDSPGSYSTVSLNGSEKNYPMQWLLDHTLLRAATPDSKVEWQKVEGEESRWFRLPQGLRYPIELENMRYQLHLFRRIG